MHFYLGIQFLHIEGGILLSQQRFIEKLLMQLGMATFKHILTPMEIGVKSPTHDVGDAFDVVTYQQDVGCLIYSCMTQFDIQFAVSQLSRFIHSLRTKHVSEYFTT